MGGRGASSTGANGSGRNGGGGDRAGSPSENLSRVIAAGDDLMNATSDEEAEAIKNYTAKGYERINSKLRSGSAPGEKTQALIDNLDAVMAQSKTPAPVTVYRGVDPYGEMQTALDAGTLIPGTIIRDKGFMSTSTDITRTIVDVHDVIFKIQVPKGVKGAYIAGLADNTSEREFLLPRNTSIKVTAVNRKYVGNYELVKTLITAKVVND